MILQKLETEWTVISKMKPEEELAIRKLFNSNKAEQYKSFTGAWNGALIAVLKATDVFAAHFPPRESRYSNDLLGLGDADYDNFFETLDTSTKEKDKSHLFFI